MSALSKRAFLFVIFLLGIITLPIFAQNVKPYSSKETAKQRINLDQPGVASTFRRFEESAPTLIKLLQAIFEIALTALWILDAGLNAFLWLLNETISSCTDLCVRIFGILFNVVKFLEALGFGIKFVLEINHAVLSRMFDTVGSVKAGFNDAVTLVKITIANQTEHVYESSSMVLEGVQNLFLTACNQTWVNIQYISSVVTTNFNFTVPFGLSALDLGLLTSMFLTGLEFFVESVKMSGGIFKDGILYVFNYSYTTVCKLGENVLEFVAAFVCSTRDVIAMVTAWIVYMFTLPFYFLASVVSNISHMLRDSWFAFVNWVGYLDLSLREMVYSVLQTIRLSLLSIVHTASGGISSIVYTIAGRLSNVFHIIINIITTLAHSVSGLINSCIPGGFLGCIALLCISVVLYLWHRKITSLLLSSWISLRRMNENARQNINIVDGRQQVDNEQEFEEDMHVADRNMAEPPLDREISQNQTKLKHELELEKDKRLCVICQDNVKNILLMPCRHVCMCRQCLREIRQGRLGLLQCPLCRTRIESSLEVFV